MKRNSFTKNQQKQIQQFKQMTQCSDKQAQTYLGNAKWNFQNAINNFYNDQGNRKKQPINQVQEIEQLFSKLATQNKLKQMVIDEDGLTTFLSDYLKVNLESPIVGFIMTNCMNLGKAEMGKIKKEQFYNLFTYAKVKSLKQLQGSIPKFEKQLSNPQTFRNMYMKLYDIYLIQNFTTLDFEVAEILWSFYLKEHLKFYKQFFQYLSTLGGKKPPKVHRDLWRMVYQFSVSIKNVTDYKQEDGWPVLIDQFIEFLKQKK